MSKIKPNVVLKVIWKDICLVPGYEQFTNYEISSTGLVRNKISGLLLIACINSRGYLNLTLCQDSYRKTIRIHRVLGILFVDNPENYPIVDHKDGCKTNNSLRNLRWVTESQSGHNRKKQSNNTSGYKNIYSHYNNGKPVWKIAIMVEGKRTHRYFKRDTEDPPPYVIEFRDKMLKELHKDFACFRN